MDEPWRTFLTVASGVGLGQLILFWVRRRSRRADARDGKALDLEACLLAERRDLLAALRAQLAAEQDRSARLETEKLTLLKENFDLQKYAHEVLAKYDFLRLLGPSASVAPVIAAEPAATPPATPARHV